MKPGKQPFSNRLAFGDRGRENIRLMTYKGKLLHGPMRKQVIAELIAEQENRCAICDYLLLIPHLDHNHITMEARGLLCSTCNTGLGMFQDNIFFLEQAIEYLKK